jgi:hypothetical protein
MARAKGSRVITAKSRGKRLLRRLAVVVGLLVVLIGFAPLLIAHTPLLRLLITAAASDLQGSVHVGRASLSWFSAPVLEDVELRDPEGKTILSVGRAAGNKTLLGLVLNSRDLGTFQIARPSLYLSCSGGLTNLERALARYLQPSTSSSSTALPAVQVQWAEGKVVLRDEDNPREWTFDDLGGSAQVAKDPGAPIALQWTARAADEANPGKVAAVLSLHLPEGREGLAGLHGECRVDMDGFPLASLTPLLRRTELGLDLAGTVGVHVQGSWAFGTAALPELHLTGELSARGLALAAAALGKDRLQLGDLKAGCDVALEAGQLAVRRAEAHCDLLDASVVGHCRPEDGVLALLEEPGWRVRLDADLARLAGMLSSFVPAAAQARLTSGRLDLRLDSTARTGGVVWEGALHTTALAGVRNGQAIAWQNPLAVDFRILTAPQTLPVVEQWRCDSGFLQASLAGSAEQLRATAFCDLDRLAAQLAQFLDLGGIRLAGKARTELTVRRDRQDAFRAEGSVELQGLDVKGLGGAAIHEDALTVKADLSGGLHEGLPRRLDAAALHLQAGQESVDAQLVEPIADLLGGSWGSVEVLLRGNLARLLARARSWVPALADLTPVDGLLSGRLSAKASQGRLSVNGDLAIADLLVGNPGAPLWREPRVVVSARAHHESDKDLVQIEQVRIESVALTASASGKIARLSATGDLALAGTLQYDLQKLQAGLRSLLGQDVQLNGKDTRPFHVEGSLTGSAPLLAGLTGEAGVGWQSARVYGCEVGPGELKASLGGGWARVLPVEATLNQGKLHLESGLRLAPEPMELHVGKGTGVERFQLTPAACSSALGYALPGLANVLAAEGQLSLVVESARVPLANPTAAEVEGRFVIHSGRVAPGPLVRELQVLLRVPAGANLARESIVPFRMANGRISHSNLELVFPDLTVRTHGSVGVDGSLDLVAEMPVPPKWVGGSTAGKVLASQTVRIPIRGTLSSPKLDEHALRSAFNEAARQVGQEAIKQGLDKRLKDVLKPRK